MIRAFLVGFALAGSFRLASAEPASGPADVWSAMQREVSADLLQGRISEFVEPRLKATTSRTIGEEWAYPVPGPGSDADSKKPPSPTSGPAAKPVRSEPVAFTRLYSWRLGNDSSLLAFLNSVGKREDEVEVQAKELAAKLGVTVAPLPPMPGNPEGNRDVTLEYMRKELNGKVVEALTERYGDDHSSLFLLASQPNFLSAAYSPGGELGPIVIKNFRELGPRAGIPEKLYSTLIHAIESGASRVDLLKIADQTLKDISEHLKQALKK